jgi:hypothetical protein
MTDALPSGLGTGTGAFAKYCIGVLNKMVTTMNKGFSEMSQVYYNLHLTGSLYLKGKFGRAYARPQSMYARAVCALIN